MRAAYVYSRGTSCSKLRNDIVGGFALGISLESADQAMAEYEWRQGCHILAGNIKPALTSGPSAPGIESETGWHADWPPNAPSA
jgi:hypothetical protein